MNKSYRILSVERADERSAWENFSPLQKNGIFLQSVNQKEIYELLQQKTWCLEYQGTAATIRSLVTKVKAKRGTFLFLPYGPMIEGMRHVEDLKTFFTNLTLLSSEEKAAFIRICPYWPDTSENQTLLKQLGFRLSPIHMLAETLWILDLQGKKEEEILSNMEKKHRNLIRRAVKENVKVRLSTSQESLDRFLSLHWQTVERHQFTPYPKEYFKAQVECFAPYQQVSLFEAWWNKELLASAIIMFYEDVAAYHHGASSSKEIHRKIPASYLLQWEAIREAIRRGCHQYNFWGISPKDNPKHPFYGITHFKTGFGGRRLDLIPAHDLVLNSKYYFNWIIEKVRKWKRGF